MHMCIYGFYRFSTWYTFGRGDFSFFFSDSTVSTLDTFVFTFSFICAIYLSPVAHLQTHRALDDNNDKASLSAEVDWFLYWWRRRRWRNFMENRLRPSNMVLTISVKPYGIAIIASKVKQWFLFSVKIAD